MKMVPIRIAALTISVIAIASLLSCSHTDRFTERDWRGIRCVDSACQSGIDSSVYAVIENISTDSIRVTIKQTSGTTSSTFKVISRDDSIILGQVEVQDQSKGPNSFLIQTNAVFKLLGDTLKMQLEFVGFELTDNAKLSSEEELFRQSTWYSLRN